MSERNSVILQMGSAWWRLQQPKRVVTAVQPGEVVAALQEVEAAVFGDSLYAAGFLSYEAGAAFGLRTHAPLPDDPPLLWFGLYQKPVPVSPPAPAANGSYKLGRWQPAITETEYHQAIAAIKEQIAAGYTYQVNYTYPLHASFRGDAWALFCRLAQAQRAAYMAYVDLGRYAICSASPELFFTLDGERFASKPMKGTAVRGLTLAADQVNMNALHHSEKDRAENVMIVDMIRNDVGRVAAVGSVQVPRLFAVERYPTVLQMTSTVSACTAASFSKLITALFPCASITGAPKRSTMDIINKLEPQPRGVYTGAIGLLTPQREAQFNVAIRTVIVDRQRQRATYGVGSGIIWDSDAAAEYEECRIKTDVLTVQPPDFDLLESLLWTPDRSYFLLEAHLARLLDSAAYFLIPVTEAAVCRLLQATAATLTEATKVRLLLAQDGGLSVDTVPLVAGAQPEPLRVGLAKTAVDSGSVWLYHKTTRRQVYDAARSARPDCDEVLLWNERGEVTEAGSANVVVQLDGRLVTPPQSSGLLAGTMRGWLLRNGRIEEGIVTLDDLRRSERLWLINSVRQWRSAHLY